MPRNFFTCALFLFLPLPAVADDTESAEMAYNRGIEALKSKDYDKAIEEFTTVIRLDPKQFGAFRWRGFAYAEKKEFDKAIDDLSEAIRLDPKNARAFYGRGIANSNKENYDKAIQDLSDAVRLDPKYAAAFRARKCSRTKERLQQGHRRLFRGHSTRPHKCQSLLQQGIRVL